MSIKAMSGGALIEYVTMRASKLLYDVCRRIEGVRGVRIRSK